MKKMGTESCREGAERFVSDLLRIACPHLVTSRGGLGTAVSNLMEHLSACFDAVDFDVKCWKLEGKERVEVSWTDGPTNADVREACEVFVRLRKDEGGRLVRKPETAWMRTFGSLDWIEANRGFSNKTVLKILGYLGEKYGEPFKELSARGAVNKGMMEEEIEFNGRKSKVKEVVWSCLKNARIG